ncbi:MAG: type I-E CRISPR-associated protein Cse2/CasB [Ferrimonas sp.]
MDNCVSSPLKYADKTANFVDYVIRKTQQDTGFSARLRRADNPATEYQSWEILAEFGIDLEKPWQRLPYCLIGAALAKAKPSADGALTLGHAIAACYEDGNRSAQAKARLRRVLACTDTPELCRILRPLLTLIHSRGIALNYSMLLKDLTYFSSQGRERICAQWAQQFYRRTTPLEGEQA